MTAEPPGVETRFRMRVLGTRLHVHFLAAAEKSPGGIILLGSLRDNYCHARVIASGPGMRTRRGSYAPTGFVAGDHVIFTRYDAFLLNRDEATVRAEEVIARLMEDETGEMVIVPENDWCLVARVEAEATLKSGLLLPESVRRRGQNGILVDAGPGRWRETGPLQGTRETVLQTWGLEETTRETRIRVYWGLRPAAVQLTHRGESVFLVRAGEINAAVIEEETPP